MSRYIKIGCYLVVVCMLNACGAKEVFVKPNAADTVMIKTSIINTSGKKIGTAEISPTAEGVKIHLVAAKLPPGMHGIHIHEVGLCEKPDFTTAGMHLNPSNKHHGFENPQGFHAGDLPNIEVGTDGRVTVDLVDNAVTLEKGKPNSLLRSQGVSLIIHEKSDDYKTDPTGNSGGRIACGVINN
jgi:superoxide dismutase, Cu-Zn family